MMLLPMPDPLGQKMSRGASQKLTKLWVKKSDPQATSLPPTVFNPFRKAGKVKMIRALSDIDQPKEKRDSIAQSIIDELGDQQSRSFYLLVAAKIPEPVIRNVLAEIKADGARYPARVFTFRMQQYALDQHKKTLYAKHEQPKKRP